MQKTPHRPPPYKPPHQPKQGKPTADNRAPQRPSASSTAATAGTTDATSSVTVRTGDTAGRIAAAHAITGISLDQMLVAMLRNNPSAFINGNINRIKAARWSAFLTPNKPKAPAPKKRDKSLPHKARISTPIAANWPNAPPKPRSARPSAAPLAKCKHRWRCHAATTPTDKLTLSKGAAASKVEDKLMAEKQSTAQNDRTKELERNLAELEKLSDASAATTAAGSVAASAETAMPPTPGDNAIWQAMPLRHL